jgi:hypothetical protein
LILNTQNAESSAAKGDADVELDVIFVQFFPVLAAALAFGGFSDKLDGGATHRAGRLA